MIPPEWSTAIEPAAAVSITMVIGESETGKTTLVAGLANALVDRGFRVGIVDADLGQSEIGPPTTIGLGRVTSKLTRPADAELVGFHFVGVTSPARNRSGAVDGTRRIVDRARAAGFERVIVDTSGLIAGGFGRSLKEAKITRVGPDLLICLERAAECAPLAERYARLGHPAVLRLPALANPRRRSQEYRRLHRQRALDAYFARARSIEIDLSRIPLRAAGAPPADPAQALENALVGLMDASGETLGLGVVRAIDAARLAVTIDTPIAAEGIASVMIGDATYEP